MTLSIPTIHCASCVWLLEQLWRFEPGVVRAEVDLLRRAVHVEFRSDETTLRRVAETIASLGYEPAITIEDGRLARPPAIRRLYLQLGVAGFAFGNIMLFSIPRYANGGPLEGGFQRLFDVLNILFALPVLLFSASDYFRIAWRAVRTRVMALEVPLALGLAVLFGRSLVDIASGRGEGFMDSFAGLVFFLLIGRLFQHKAFDRIAFDRTFRSFLPLSVQTERDGEPTAMPIEQLRSGDRIRVRPLEVVPADSALLDEAGIVDYAFITGEQTPVAVERGQTVRAGGRVVGRALRLRVPCDVTHSQLASSVDQSGFQQTEGALAGGRDGAIRRLVHGWRDRIRGRRSDCLVARCGSKRQRRDSSPHHRVPVRAHAVGTDHPRHRHGLARDARPLFEVAGGRPRPQPDRHGGV